MRRLLPIAAGAALAGLLHGLAEAAALQLGGRLWIATPPLLLATAGAGGTLLGALAGTLPALLGRGRVRGVLGGFVSLAALDLLLAIATDPPPFQQPPWYVGNPLAVAGVLAGALALLLLARRRPLAGLALAALAALGGPASRAVRGRPELPPSPGPLPNLLLVTLDTTRADHVGAYGYERIDTPVFDRLAREGVLYEHARSQIAVTGPSHTTIFTGQGTWSHGSLLNGIPVSDDQRLLSERLSAIGYDTGAFVSAYVLTGSWGYARGFRVYDDDFSTPKGASRLLPWRIVAAARRHFRPDEVLERRGGHTVDDALDWLAGRSPDRPWFLWVHLFDAHGPYAPPPPFDTLYYDGDPRDPAHTSMQRVHDVAPYLRRSLEGITDLAWVIAQYDGEIAYADTQLGRLVEALEARPDADRTLVVVAGDHGESLGEGDVWFDHGDDLLDASTRVPLVFWWPGRVPAGVRVEAPVELTDVLPTTLELLRLPPVGEIDGRSTVPLWSGGEGRPFARGLCFDRVANLADREAGRITQPRWRMVALRSSDALYVHRESPSWPDAWYEGDDQEHPVLDAWLAEDPAHAEILEVLRGVARNLLQASEGGVERSGITLSEEERERLEALGYVE